MQFRVIAVLSILALVLVGCRAQTEVTAEDVTIEILSDVSDVTIGEETTLDVQVTDGDGNPVNDATVSVRGDMDHAGMAPVLGTLESGEDGIYAIPFAWSMGGDWIVDIEVTLPNGDVAAESFEYTIASDGMDMDDMDMDVTGDDMEAMGMDDDEPINDEMDMPMEDNPTEPTNEEEPDQDMDDTDESSD